MLEGIQTANDVTGPMLIVEMNGLIKFGVYQISIDRGLELAQRHGRSAPQMFLFKSLACSRFSNRPRTITGQLDARIYGYRLTSSEKKKGSQNNED